MIKSRFPRTAAGRSRHSAPGGLLLLAICLLSAPTVLADDLQIEVRGLSEPSLGNVRSRVQGLYLGGGLRLSSRRREQIAEQAAREAGLALRPYGFYRSEVATAWTRIGDESWRLDLDISAGEPARISEARIELEGAGKDLPELREWRRDWPLGVGAVLDQTVWEARKQAALDIAEGKGYLNAGFSEHVIELDLVENTAATRLTLDTGQQAVMGEIRFEQDAVREGILDILPRFSEGQPYDAWLLEKFRLDLWRTGYFENVQVIEERRLEEQPPKVNLVVRADSRPPNTYQGSLGWGTDTGIRAQVVWRRYLLSDRGDYFDLGAGWQEKFNQYSLRSSYRMPRRSRAREFWTADLLINRQRQDVRIKEDDQQEDFIQLATGDVTDYSVKAGRLVVRDFERGYQQIFENWYGQYVYETASYDLAELAFRLGLEDPERELGILDDGVSALALGISWDWPDVRGSGFETTGHRERAWITTANEAWGSDGEFTQAYLSSGWQWLFRERWKLLLRGEVGFTDADVRDVDIEVDGRPLNLSVTSLPNFYRFKAGGSRSVRGYAFESLSNNGLGSNNIITASAEVEWRMLPTWSLAAFIDAGNAFNDWDEVEIRKGAGVGLRWYSIAGALRLDVAQALDFEGKPWRVHFTIGTPLL